MYSKKSILSAITALLAIVFAVSSCSKSDGDITFTANSSTNFTVSTTTYSGHYAPRHVLAIWVENSSGTFVKTLVLNAAARKQYLTNWIKASAQNTTDASTGATLNAHSSHSVTWNLKDKSGTTVSNGSYKLCVEYTEDNATGKCSRFDFTVGSSSAVKQSASQSGITVNY